jgi:hypothetical protein
VRELRAQRRDLITEWEATFEKFNALWARLAKRLKDYERQKSPQDGAGGTNGPPGGVELNPLALELLRRR